MKKLKVAVCGFGAFGKLHSENLAEIDTAELVAICDINPETFSKKDCIFNIERPDETEIKKDIEFFTDYSEMLSKISPEAVVLALPTSIHAEYAIIAMKKGIHVFVEKPMALTVNECDKMILEARKSNVNLIIGQCLRFWPEYQELAKIYQTGRYGKLHSIVLNRMSSYPRRSGGRNWFLDGKISGGALLDLHLHDIDYLYHSFGKPDSLCASGIRGMTGEYDDLTAIWKYKNFIATVRGSWMSQGFCVYFQALFDEAVVEYGLATDTSMRARLIKTNGIEKIQVPLESAYLNEMKYFIDCSNKLKPNEICRAESTRNSVALAYYEKKAADSGKWISNFKLI